MCRHVHVLALSVVKWECFIITSQNGLSLGCKQPHEIWAAELDALASVASGVTLKTLDTIGNCQRPVFSLAVS